MKQKNYVEALKEAGKILKKNENELHQVFIVLGEIARGVETPTGEWMPTPELKIRIAGSYRKEFVEKMTEILDSPKVTINGSHSFHMKLRVLYQAFAIAKMKEEGKEDINFTTFCDYFFNEKEK